MSFRISRKTAHCMDDDNPHAMHSLAAILKHRPELRPVGRFCRFARVGEHRAH
jgi:hypothetical protein